MKRYTVNISRKNDRYSFSVLARDEKAARNKAVRHNQHNGKDISISHADIESVIYEGFYLNRVFIPADYMLARTMDKS